MVGLVQKKCTDGVISRIIGRKICKTRSDVVFFHGYVAFILQKSATILKCNTMIISYMYCI